MAGKSEEKHRGFPGCSQGRSGLDEVQDRLFLPQCMDLMVLESQLLHKNVKLLFTITDQNIKLTVLWGH